MQERERQGVRASLQLSALPEVQAAAAAVPAQPPGEELSSAALADLPPGTELEPHHRRSGSGESTASAPVGMLEPVSGDALQVLGLLPSFESLVPRQPSQEPAAAPEAGAAAAAEPGALPGAAAEPQPDPDAASETDAEAEAEVPGSPPSEHLLETFSSLPDSCAAQNAAWAREHLQRAAALRSASQEAYWASRLRSKKQLRAQLQRQQQQQPPLQPYAQPSQQQSATQAALLPKLPLPGWKQEALAEHAGVLARAGSQQRAVSKQAGLQAVPLTKDHRPGEPSEMGAPSHVRLLAAGVGVQCRCLRL